MTTKRKQLDLLDQLAKIKIKSLDEHVQLFAMTAEQNAWGYSSAFHAGINAVRKDIAETLSAILLANPELLQQKLSEL